MGRRLGALVAFLLVPAASAMALAPVAPRHPAGFLYVKYGSFSISLVTKTATQIMPGKPIGSRGRYQASGVLLLCPGSQATELHLGFRGAKLEPTDNQLGFVLSYTERHARLVVLKTGATTVVPAKLTITGTVVSATKIAGTVAVRASGCNLKPSKYHARFATTF
jgi:hypothetical protein